MKKISKLLISSVILSSCLIIKSFSAPVTADNQHLTNMVKNSDLSPQVVSLALKARQYAADHTSINKNILAIVDYTKPSTEPRLYVFNMANDELMMKLRVAHGHNSGTPLTAKYFSNSPRSRQSSLGVFVTGETYSGEHGYSRRIIGLEPNINSNAYDRALVIHAASYVNPGFVGRSFGCLAVNPSDAPKLISTLAQGSVIFSYALPENSDKNILSQPL